MAALAACVRITARSCAVWRTCAGCHKLAALAPDETHCPGCRPAARPRSGRK